MAGIEQLKGSLISKNGMAFANQYSVEMPAQLGKDQITKLLGMDPKTANILCKSVTMPGKQILTLDRQVGIFNTVFEEIWCFNFEFEFVIRN